MGHAPTGHREGARGGPQLSALRAQIAVLPNASEPRLRSGRRCCAAANLKKACGPANQILHHQRRARADRQHQLRPHEPAGHARGRCDTPLASRLGGVAARCVAEPGTGSLSDIGAASDRARSPSVIARPIKKASSGATPR
jgi:hypothetical protein